MSVDLIITRFITQGASGLTGTLRGLEGNFRQYESASERALMSSQRWGMGMVAVGAIGVRAFANLTSASLQAAGQVQRVETGYLSVLKNAEAARKLSADVRAFDVATPFSYLASANASQMLLAAGFREDLIPTMYAIGNATVAAGKGTDTFVRALAIMSKIKTSGTLTAVRINQFASAGINIKDILKKELGLSDDDMVNIGRLHLKADVVLPAINRGLMEKFGGAIQKAADTYLGSLEILAGSQDKLKASIGKSIAPEATALVKHLIDMTNAVEGFVSTHPRLTAATVAVGGIGSAVLALGGAYKVFRYYQLQAAAANALLTMSQRRETAEELRKIPVAYAEARAHQAAALATMEHAGANRMLALPGPMGVPPVGAGAGAASGVAQAGLMARMGAFMGRPLISQAALTGISASRYGAMPGWIFNGLNGATVGTGMAGGAIGLAAGLGTKADMEALGYSAAQSATMGIATGLGAAALSAFNPPAAALIAAATVLRYSVDTFYNKPLEEAATQGDGIQALDRPGLSREEQAQEYDRKAEQKRKEAREVTNNSLINWWPGDVDKAAQLQAEADQAATTARGLRQGDREENSPEARYARWTADTNARFDAQRAKERDIARRSGTEDTSGQLDTTRPGRPASDYDLLLEDRRQREARAAQVRAESQVLASSQPEVIEHRNGATVIRFAPIRLENREAAQQQRTRRLRATTAMPDLAR